MDAEDLKQRTKLFALRILKLAAALPNNVQGRTVGGQLVRFRNLCWVELSSCLSRTLKGGIHCEARHRGRAADESAFWLELIIEGFLLNAQLVQPLLDEANELTRIMASSRITASSKVKSDINRGSK